MSRTWKFGRTAVACAVALCAGAQFAAASDGSDDRGRRVARKDTQEQPGRPSPGGKARPGEPAKPVVSQEPLRPGAEIPVGSQPRGRPQDDNVRR